MFATPASGSFPLFSGIIVVVDCIALVQNHVKRGDDTVIPDAVTTSDIFSGASGFCVNVRLVAAVVVVVPAQHNREGGDTRIISKYFLFHVYWL